MPSQDKDSSESKVDDNGNLLEEESMEVEKDKLEIRMNITDFRRIMEMFSEGEDFLNFNREQFIEALLTIGATGTKEEFGKMFDRIDVTKDGNIDWDKFASHMLVEFYEKDDKVKSNQLPHWSELKVLSTTVHKDIVQGVCYLRSNNRYIAISKEGSITLWTPELRLNRSVRTTTDTCRNKDLWVTDFVPLPPPINKIALAFTSKEIAIYDMSTKIDFTAQYKIVDLEATPLCLDFWVSSTNPNEAILVWGDVAGHVNAINFSSATTALFERPAAPAGGKQDPCLTVKLSDIKKNLYKNAKFVKHKGHSEWVRKVKYCHGLECFISCATTYTDSLVIGWLEQDSPSMKTSKFQITQGINDFDFHSTLNLIATGGVNHQVCLWNPYVVSKPNGLLRGHMASVIQVQFLPSRNQLLSFSKDKVLRIWDISLQVCIQRLAGMFPKGGEAHSVMFFDEVRNNLFITFNYQLTVMSLKAENRDRIVSHEKPVAAALYNSTYDQIVSIDSGGTITFWSTDTGQRLRVTTETHPDAEITCLTQDSTGTLLYTGSADGTIKVWDFNGHCYHILHASPGPADISRIIVNKKSVIAVGWARFITVFRISAFKDFHVQPSDWKGGQEEHRDEILAASQSSSGVLATASHDGEIILWNNNSETVLQKLSLKLNKTALPPISRSASSNSSASQGQGKPRSRHDQIESDHTITTVCFLETRGEAGKGANLVCCGGNGWVRFWNTSKSVLVGEFVAHQQAGSIIMATDQHNSFLVTADVNGLVKAWIIKDYNAEQLSEGKVNTALPKLLAYWSPHVDSVTSLTVFERLERTLVLSAGSDYCVVLSDIKGKIIGVFGQELPWTIDPYTAGYDDDLSCSQVDSEYSESVGSGSNTIEDDWRPDERATTDPKNFKIDSWQSSLLGSRYQEVRKQKRERRQPTTIPDLPYLFWEKTGAPPAGPFNALETKNLEEVDVLRKPAFMNNPHKYFGEKIEDVIPSSNKLPLLTDSLKTAFDEKSLFPKYILDYEYESKKAQNPSNIHKRTSLNQTRQMSGSKRSQSKQMMKATKTSSSNKNMAE